MRGHRNGILDKKAKLCFNGSMKSQQGEDKMVKCPLCGATVNPEEIQEHGYCQVCRLLVESLTGVKKRLDVLVEVGKQSDERAD